MPGVYGRHRRPPQLMPAVVDRATWQAERDALLVREKAHTREGDAIAAARRRLPMVPAAGQCEGCTFYNSQVRPVRPVSPRGNEANQSGAAAARVRPRWLRHGHVPGALADSLNMAPVEAQGHGQAGESADQHGDVHPVPGEDHKGREHDWREQGCEQDSRPEGKGGY